jgi:hypothetical protein
MKCCCLHHTSNDSISVINQRSLSTKIVEWTEDDDEDR